MVGVSGSSIFEVRGKYRLHPVRDALWMYKDRCQAIRNSPDTPISFPVRIVHLLDTTSAGDVILAHRHFHTSVIRKFTRRLHEPFPKERCPTNTARSISCKEPETISAAEAEAPLIRTAIGITVSSGSPGVR